MEGEVELDDDGVDWLDTDGEIWFALEVKADGKDVEFVLGDLLHGVTCVIGDTERDDETEDEDK